MERPSLGEYAAKNIARLRLDDVHASAFGACRDHIITGREEEFDWAQAINLRPTDEGTALESWSTWVLVWL